MKKGLSLALGGSFCLCLAGCSGGGGFLAWLLIPVAILALGLALLRTYNHYQYMQKVKKRPGRYKKRKIDRLTLLLYPFALLLFLIVGLTSCGGSGADVPSVAEPTQTTVATEPSVPETEPPSLFQPYTTADTDPLNYGIIWERFRGAQPLSDYRRAEKISFGTGENYFALPGISTFRGDNYRSGSAYGTAAITEGTLTEAWSVDTGTLPGSTWSGSGWTGQPLIVQWDAATRQNMNLYEEKKLQEDLVEVIYPTLDGHIYFLDLSDGSYTRDPLYMGFCFKGSGTLDPRGYPILYVGGGDVCGGQRPRMFVISLIDGSTLYEYGHEDALAMRKDNGNWCAFDSAPLVDANSDTLIWPGENGILYTIRLGTQYDPETGSLSLSPETPVTTRYRTNRSNEETYWLGYEASVSIVENYLYISENGGMFYCVDLNTMELVWAQDTRDDSNASPVLERVSEEEAYIYTAPSLHWTANPDKEGIISVYKLDAITGQVIWEAPYGVHTVQDVSGGMQATAVLGKPGTTLEGILVCAIARTPNLGTGILVGLDTATGGELWRYTTDFYAWSSPVAVYDEAGTGYILLGDTGSKLHLVDGATGNPVTTLTLNGNIEATPAVYNSRLVVGTREEKIYGIDLG